MDDTTTPRVPRGTLLALALATLLPALGTSIANIGLPALAAALHAPFERVQWVVIAYLVASTALVVGAGRLGDLFGHRRLLLAGGALYTAASAMGAVAPGLAWLVAARAVQGVGAATMTTLAMAFVGQAVPRSARGRALGLLAAMSAVGTALGPSLGGGLMAVFGWRALFAATVVPGLALVALAWRWLPANAATRTRTSFDILGTALLASALGAYALAMTSGRGSLGSTQVVLLAGAALASAAFARVQSRAASPLVRLSMLREPGLAASLAMTALVMTVMMATLVVGPFYLARGLGLGAAAAGAAMSIGPVVSALSGYPAGRLVDRFGARPAMRVAMAGMALGALAVLVAPGLPGYLAAIALMTVHYALFQAANNTAVMADVEASERGVVSGLLNLARNLGTISGASLMGAVFTAGAGDPMRAAPTAVAAGMRLTFGVATALLLVGLALAFARRTRATGVSAIRG